LPYCSVNLQTAWRIVIVVYGCLSQSHFVSS
jgi:hypothetical protein